MAKNVPKNLQQKNSLKKIDDKVAGKADSKADNRAAEKMLFDAIILCAGEGRRFNVKTKHPASNTVDTTQTDGRETSTSAKILVNLHGKPALAYLLQTIVASPFVRNCVLVVPAQKAVEAKIVQLAQAYLVPRDKCNLLVAQGGVRRQDSVKNGLLALQKIKQAETHCHQNEWCKNEWCMIFDAARPLVSTVLIERIATRVALATRNQNEEKILGVIPLLPLTDSVKTIDKKGQVIASLERETLRLAQTPQAFPRRKLLEWLEQAEQKTPQKTFDDEAQLAIENSAEIKHIQGEARAHKITTQQDITILEGFLTARQTIMTTEKPHPEYRSYPEYRTCSGFDQHKTRAGDALRLCGIDLPCSFALDGHSDADVALHALTDAILALAGSGDIGEHFPPTEKRWRNADSAIFLNHAIEQLKRAGGELVNADITILAEKPNLRTYKNAMREKLAQLTALDRSRIGLKATTLENLGALGRAEGIAAYACATAKFF